MAVENDTFPTALSAILRLIYKAIGFRAMEITSPMEDWTLAQLHRVLNWPVLRTSWII